MLRWVRQGALAGERDNGQWQIRLGPLPGEDAIQRLWHGTTRDRLDSLLEHGLWMMTNEKQTWLTTNELQARLHAISRAQIRRSTPVLVGCEVDLRRYPIFWRRSARVYVFHQPLDRDVITSVQDVDPRERSRKFRMNLRRRRRGFSRVE